MHGAAEAYKAVDRHGAAGACRAVDRHEAAEACRAAVVCRAAEACRAAGHRAVDIYRAVRSESWMSQGK